MWRDLDLPYTIYLPTAKLNKFSVFGDVVLNSFFNTKADESRTITSGVTASARDIDALMRREQIDIVGGLSQGGAMALYTSLGYSDYRVKGVFALSSFNLEYPVKHPDIPAFIYHGGNDIVLPWSFSQPGYEDIKLKELYLEGKMQHVISDSMCVVLKNWLHRTLNPRSFL
jgi:predicted esterase